MEYQRSKFMGTFAFKVAKFTHNLLMPRNSKTFEGGLSSAFSRNSGCFLSLPSSSSNPLNISSHHAIFDHDEKSSGSD
jgi:hypothetical protein